VNADIPSIDIIMVPERDDRVNPLGIKGVGELGIVGMNAAVANAVFNATGKRARASHPTRKAPLAFIGCARRRLGYRIDQIGRNE
jgi:CO/xanthine dehydrogenase Mo-binding subunit